ncbi:gastrula zinc finger protein XlCGF57.1-like [Aphelenchoides avenae]|nr:gastrula zinc finger protein XlCGF57.1-like [Aphelenchus avenae]
MCSAGWADDRHLCVRDKVVQHSSPCYAIDELTDSQQTDSEAASGNELSSESSELEDATLRRGTQLTCGHCDYRTSSRDTLRQHVRTHTKPFRCEECGYRAASHNTFTDHLRIHTGAKPYRCEHCDYRTAKKCNLVVHTRKHTGLKPYACAYGNCDYRATRLDVMRVHLPAERLWILPVSFRAAALKLH